MICHHLESGAECLHDEIYKMPQSVNVELQTSIAADYVAELASMRWVDWSE